MRAKWSAPIRKYWKISEQMMVKYCDLAICDSVNIEKYIHECYDRKGIKGKNPKTTFIAYGADERWLENATADADVATELKTLDDTKIEDAFYRDLAFGTGGLRGVIGAGTNRMNIYTVAKASQGLADYLKKNFTEPSVAIGYDSRIKSDVFAKVAAGVFSANGVKVNIWPVLMPVPTVSFATRYLHTSAGVMITASHNPSKYNGYKVYGADGCQITTEAAAEILAEIEKLDIFTDVKHSDFEVGLANGNMQMQRLRLRRVNLRQVPLRISLAKRLLFAWNPAVVIRSLQSHWQQRIFTMN